MLSDVFLLIPNGANSYKSFNIKGSLFQSAPEMSGILQPKKSNSIIDRDSENCLPWNTELGA